jgi:hypothetical protein
MYKSRESYDHSDRQTPRPETYTRLEDCRKKIFAPLLAMNCGYRTARTTRSNPHFALLGARRNTFSRVDPIDSLVINFPTLLAQNLALSLAALLDDKL